MRLGGRGLGGVAGRLGVGVWIIRRRGRGMEGMGMAWLMLGMLRGKGKARLWEKGRKTWSRCREAMTKRSQRKRSGRRTRGLGLVGEKKAEARAQSDGAVSTGVRLYQNISPGYFGKDYAPRDWPPVSPSSPPTLSAVAACRPQ